MTSVVAVTMYQLIVGCAMLVPVIQSHASLLLGVCAMGLRNAPEKALRTSIAAQLGVRNGKLFPLKWVRKPRAMHSNNS